MVLITGATGLVGSHLALQLVEKGEEVRAIYRNPNSLNKTKTLFGLYQKEDLFVKIEWVQGDITDIPSLEIAFKNIDYVYHCAGFISFDPKEEETLRKVNIEGTANIVNLSITHKVKKMCFVSSVAALGDLTAPEKLLTEEMQWNPEKPHSDYAISKYGAEMEVWRGQQEGLQVAVLNPGVILGPGFWGQGSGELFSSIANGLRFYTKGATGFVAVTDVVELLLKLMKGNSNEENHENQINGERFIIVAENIVFKDVLNMISNALKTKQTFIYSPFWMTEIAWRFDWIGSTFFKQKRKLSKTTARTAHVTHLYSNEKTKKQFNFEFRDIESYITESVSLQSKI